MAGGVNVKMGVSGVAQFKQSMNQAKQAAKTLDAQLALTEKQFKQSGDAESYMTEKAALLQAKLENQRSVVENAEKALQAMAEKGVDKGSKAYQDLYRQMIQAKGEMIDTESAISGIAEAGATAATEVGGMSEELGGVGRGISFQNVTSGLQTITESLENAAKKAYKLGSAIVKDVLGVGTWADDINTRSAVLGVSPEDLQRMEKTARLIDTDAETIIKARQKLNRNLGNRTKGAMDALAFLGVSAEGNPEDVFWKAGEALMALGDETEQEAKANDLFGKSWHELIPLFDAGREQYDKMNSSWNVMSEEQLKQLNEMDDEYQKMQQAVEDLKREALTNLAEPMKTALQAINDLLGKVSAWLGSEEGQKAVGDLVNGIKSGLEWISNNKAAVVTALGAIGVGFVGLKTALLGLNIAKTVSGLGGLFGGGDKAAQAAAQAAQASQAAQATTAASSGGWMSSAMGFFSLAAIGAAFDAARNQRINHAEQVRGTDAHLLAQSAGTEQLLASYLQAEKAKAEIDWMAATAEEAQAVAEAAQKAREALLAAEGGQQALDAYSDWRQENSKGNNYWELPEALNRILNVAEEQERNGANAMTKDEILDAIREGMANTPVNSFLDGELVTAYVSRRLAGELAIRRFTDD